jgi:hypothetical protein
MDTDLASSEIWSPAYTARCAFLTQMRSAIAEELWLNSIPDST